MLRLYTNKNKFNFKNSSNILGQKNIIFINLFHINALLNMNNPNSVYDRYVPLDPVPNGPSNSAVVQELSGGLVYSVIMRKYYKHFYASSYPERISSIYLKNLKLNRANSFTIFATVVATILTAIIVKSGSNFIDVDIISPSVEDNALKSIGDNTSNSLIPPIFFKFGKYIKLIFSWIFIIGYILNQFGLDKILAIFTDTYIFSILIIFIILMTILYHILELKILNHFLSNKDKDLKKTIYPNFVNSFIDQVKVYSEHDMLIKEMKTRNYTLIFFYIVLLVLYVLYIIYS